MSPELEAALKEKYPDFLCRMGDDPSVTCMAWGIECDDGWYSIIEDMCHEISEHCPMAIAAQIKQKFGSLRVYLDDPDPSRTDLIIRHAEKRSQETCEKCGAQGSLRSFNFQYKTLCDECAKD